MSKKKILIIGFGNIGSHHLQALNCIRSKVIIYIYDIKIKNFKLKTNNDLVILKNLNQKLNIDLAIISTNSKERFKVFSQLVNYNHVKKIIFEKFIFYKKSSFDKTLKILKKNKIKAWVNCLRREIEIYKKIKLLIGKNFTLDFKYSNWGMGSNSIHFLDLFTYLSNNKKIYLDRHDLDKKIFKSKRKGYSEFKGKLKFKVGKSFLILEDNIVYKRKYFKIKSKRYVFSFNKSENIVTQKNLKTGLKKIYKCEFPYVSNISYKVINKIINNQKIKLSSFEETVYHHKLLIDIFSKHQKTFNSNKDFMIT